MKMAPKKKSVILSELKGRVSSDSSAACCFCKCAESIEVLYGVKYRIGKFTCHHFCLLLSNHLVQNGQDDEGILGFRYDDIVAEKQRSKKKACSFCGAFNATLVCSDDRCDRRFHLPCGIRHDCLSIFSGIFESYCKEHRPMQRVPARLFMSRAEEKGSRSLQPFLQLRKLNTVASLSVCVKDEVSDAVAVVDSAPLFWQDDAVCSICYEHVDPFPTVSSFWPPCCRGDRWFHRICVAKMCLSAGRHFVKCPLCNNQDVFLPALMQYGFYIPDQDASWEREAGAFADLLQRPNSCCVQPCICPKGTDFAGAWNGQFALLICRLCGSLAAHRRCARVAGRELVCSRCDPQAGTTEPLTHIKAEIVEIESDDEDLAIDVSNHPQESTTFNDQSISSDTSKDFNTPLQETIKYLDSLYTVEKSEIIDFPMEENQNKNYGTLRLSQITLDVLNLNQSIEKEAETCLNIVAKQNDVKKSGSKKKKKFITKFKFFRNKEGVWSRKKIKTKRTNSEKEKISKYFENLEKNKGRLDRSGSSTNDNTIVNLESVATIPTNKENDSPVVEANKLRNEKRKRKNKTSDMVWKKGIIKKPKKRTRKNDNKKKSSIVVPQRDERGKFITEKPLTDISHLGNTNGNQKKKDKCIEELTVNEMESKGRFIDEKNQGSLSQSEKGKRKCMKESTVDEKEPKSILSDEANVGKDLSPGVDLSIVKKERKSVNLVMRNGRFVIENVNLNGDQKEGNSSTIILYNNCNFNVSCKGKSKGKVKRRKAIKQEVLEGGEKEKTTRKSPPCKKVKVESKGQNSIDMYFKKQDVIVHIPDYNL